MSTYQYYEFQALDRPLTETEQQAVSRLSSRVNPHPTSAIFVYNYSDFPGSAEKVLAKYYDALFFIANWGSVQIAFRFPKGLVDPQQFEPYCVPDCISYQVTGDHLVLNIERHDEGGFDYWVEGEGTLSGLIPLREAILDGDLRLLYLAWLMATDVAWDLVEGNTEPPVPPGLKELNASLRNFIDLFEVDEHLVGAAAEASLPLKVKPAVDLGQAIGNLERAEQAAWLLRLAQGERRLDLKFQRRLAEQAPRPVAPSSQPRRTVAQLQAAAERVTQKTAERKRREAQAKRIRELEALAPQAEITWVRVEQLIERKNASAYREAVEWLVKLKELAEYQNAELAFNQRLRAIRSKYARRPALMRRLNEAGLHG